MIQHVKKLPCTAVCTSKVEVTYYMVPVYHLLSSYPARHTLTHRFQYQSILPAIAEACAALNGDGDSGALRGPQLLEALHERSHFGGPDVSRTLTSQRAEWYCCGYE